MILIPIIFTESLKYREYDRKGDNTENVSKNKIGQKIGQILFALSRTVPFINDRKINSRRNSGLDQEHCFQNKIKRGHQYKWKGQRRIDQKLEEDRYKHILVEPYFGQVEIGKSSSQHKHNSRWKRQAHQILYWTYGW